MHVKVSLQTFFFFFWGFFSASWRRHTTLFFLVSDVFVAYYNDGVEKPDKADTPSPVLFVRAFSSPEAETRGGSKAYRPDVAIQPTEDEREVTEIKAQHKTNEKTRQETWKNWKRFQ